MCPSTPIWPLVFSMASGAHMEDTCLWKGREAERYPLSFPISPNPLWVFHSPSSYDYRVPPSAACFCIIWPRVLLDDLNPLKLVQSHLLRNRSPTHRTQRVNISVEYSCGPVCRQDALGKQNETEATSPAGLSRGQLNMPCAVIELYL